MNTTTLTPTSIALFSFRSFLNLVPAAFVFCALLILPQTIRADYTPTTSGTTVTFTSDGSPGVLVLGDQGGMMSYSSYAKGDVSNFKSLSSAQRVVETLSLTQVTRIVINGGPGDDTLVISNPAGSVFAPNAVIEFNGGEGFDTLILQGGGGADFHVTYTPGPTRDAGLIETTNGTACQVIIFSGLEPVLDTAPAATLTVTGTNGNNAISYTQGSVAANGLVAVDNFETIEFSNKDHLVINALGGDDTISLNNQQRPTGFTPGGLKDITVDGGDGADTLIANGIAGGAPATRDEFVVTPTAAGSGTIVESGAAGATAQARFAPVTFTNMENMTMLGQSADLDQVASEGTAGNDTFEIIPGATPDSGTITGFSTGAGAFNFVPVQYQGFAGLVVAPFDGGGADTLIADGTSGDNTFSFAGTSPPGSVGGPFQTVQLTVSGQSYTPIIYSAPTVNKVILRGGPGNDTFNINLPAPGNLNVSVRADGGGGINTLNYIAPTGAATTVDYGASLITSTGPGANPVPFSSIQFLNLTSSGASPTLTVNGTAGADNFTFMPTGANAGALTLTGTIPSLNFSGLAAVTLNGQDGSDFFNITPSSTVTVSVNGGNPTPPASPGDSINVNAAGTTGFSLSSSSTPSGQTGSFTCTNRLAVNFQQIETLSPLLVSATSINATEGVAFSNQLVATFSAAAIPVSNFAATINWGDGSASSFAAIAANGSSGAFTVKGGHTYNEEGSYDVRVRVTDLTTSATQEVISTATVADAPLAVVPLSQGSNTTFSGVGGTNTSTTAGSANAALLAFQTAIGGVNNGGTASPQNGGFRAINWDGVALDGTDFGGATTTIVPNFVVGIPVNRFQERGVNFEEVYAVSGPASGADPSTFTTVNPGVSNQFPAFSPTKTFAMFNDNTIDFNFVLPSVHNTSVPIQAVTRGFGAIFRDVETLNTTSIEYFNGTTSLGKFFVPVGASGQAEFFGVLFQNPVVTNVTITLGTATLFSFDGTNVTSGPADNPGGGIDLVVTDDFVYPEPQAVSTGININAIAGAPFTAKVASFTDADPNGQVSDYSVIIDWGDGTTSAGGVSPNAAQPDSGTITDTNASITPAVNGGFDVNGTHTYASAGTFTITTSIRDIGGASISARSTATVTGQPSLSINNVTVTEGNTGTTNAQFTVTLSSASSQTVTVDYVTADGTATAPSDYDSQAGTLTFAPGVTTRTINIAVKGDTVPEPNETFFVNLLNPVNATISTAQGMGTINDDDESGFVQFSASTASVAENAGSVSLTVTRTGDTSGVTSVNFETSDGTAVQKSDYTFNSGTIQFGPGDTSKTIQVLIVDDVFVEGPETFKVTLSNVSGNFVVGTPNQITVTITDNDSVAPTTNPIDGAQFFVRQHYLDFLGREADPSGLTFWTNQITSCGANQACTDAARVNVSAAFFLSIEYQETSGTVIRTQRVAFSRQSSDPSSRVPYLQFMRDTRQVGAGVVVGQSGFDTLLEANKQAYALQIVNSAAFVARFPIAPAAPYVDALYASAAVTPTAAERTAAINAFGAGGTLGRVAALRSVSDSNSMRQAELIPSFVLAEYYGYLRRNPTDAPDNSDAGYQFWLAKLNSFNGDFVKAEMVRAFILSNEYRQRFGP